MPWGQACRCELLGYCYRHLAPKEASGSGSDPEQAARRRGEVGRWEGARFFAAAGFYGAPLPAVGTRPSHLPCSVILLEVGAYDAGVRVGLVGPVVLVPAML